jgi:hypothetical protein
MRGNEAEQPPVVQIPLARRVQRRLRTGAVAFLKPHQNQRRNQRLRIPRRTISGGIARLEPQQATYSSQSRHRCQSWSYARASARRRLHRVGKGASM